MEAGMAKKDLADMRAERDARRQKIVEEAFTAADHIILEGSDGSNAETNLLTARVAAKFVEQALNPFSRAALRHDMKTDEEFRRGGRAAPKKG
ncbi:hypothetical protein A2110_01260 [Candidatus Jorgensenbacteria bacterium GWA1_54_12]|uniref:Uncharacterized protein n=1 Tax=Candidatus Jorgensenbacteria bacterium GWA1_54_12 TaxID=1798468 RepID=A0A1F6BIZ9_9BACT|nr:MAG: hypothetical protein A2110_01260 [Candidatus Jorgensenbacteria bacterium GWA1_54_12]